MVAICEEHARLTDLEFSTDPDPEKSKTVCMQFHGGQVPKNLTKLILNGEVIPFKERAVHIGNTLHCSGKMDQDIKEKRAKFISRSMELNQEFLICSPEVKLQMSKLYNSHFTGSPLWDFGSVNFNQLCRSWNVNLRAMFNLPWNTHCWIMEELTGGRHARQMMFSRYIKFVDKLATNKRSMIRSLFELVRNNAQTTTGSNLRTIMLETGLPINPGVTSPWVLANHRVYGGVPAGEEWKIPLLTNLIEVRDDRWQVIFDEESEITLQNEDIDAMIADICC